MENNLDMILTSEKLFPSNMNFGHCSEKAFKSIIDGQSRDTFMDQVADFLFSLLLDEFLMNYLWLY